MVVRDGTAVMQWNDMPLNSNAEYCNGNAYWVKCHSIKVWANTEVL